jgi:membrane protease subunit (stomatin/prohibitin family)
MGMLDKLRAEVVDIVEWLDQPSNALVWRFPRYHNQIKQGAQLIVRPGQVAVFVHRGRLADVFGPGTYELTTGNLPGLSTLQGWKFGFDSPFKAEVYFVSTRQITDLKWGTPNAIMLRDPQFGPIRLRAFGVYTLKATNPQALLKELVGTEQLYEVDEIQELLRSIITSALADLLGKAELSALDLAANYRAYSDRLRQAVVERVDDEYGLDVPQLYIVNISFPEEVEKALDLCTRMTLIGDMGRYQQYQTAEAIAAAAGNPAGGAAAAGVGLGLGFGLAGRIVQGVGGGPPSPSVAPPMLGPWWYLAANEQTMGPLTGPQLLEAVTAGQITAGTLVWTAGLAGWLPAAQVPALAAQFGPPPPPAR